MPNLISISSKKKTKKISFHVSEEVENKFKVLKERVASIENAELNIDGEVEKFLVKTMDIAEKEIASLRQNS